MTAAKSSAWTDEERASMVRQKAIDSRDAYECGPDGKPIAVRWLRPSICETRIGRSSDLAFVVDCWAKYENRCDDSKRISDITRQARRLLGVPFGLAHAVVELPRLLVAHVPGEPDAILGWAAFEGGPVGCIHYVYVRSAARRQGVARALVGDIETVEYSHEAPKGFALPKHWTLNLARAEA